MSYSTVTKVKSLFRNIDGGGDPALTDPEIQEFLDDAALIIDGKIGTLYQLPILVGVSPDSFAILGRLETYLVASTVDDVLNTYGEADKKPEWGKKGHALLNELVPPLDKKTKRQPEPTMKLHDATYLGTSTERGRVKFNPTSGRIFEKGENNW